MLIISCVSEPNEVNASQIEKSFETITDSSQFSSAEVAQDVFKLFKDSSICLIEFFTEKMTKENIIAKHKYIGELTDSFEDYKQYSFEYEFNSYRVVINFFYSFDKSKYFNDFQTTTIICNDNLVRDELFNLLNSNASKYCSVELSSEQYCKYKVNQLINDNIAYVMIEKKEKFSLEYTIYNASEL